MKERKSNIELLRIISMIMIVAHHFSVHGKFVLKTTEFLNTVWLQLLSSGGKIGVNIFVIISGYFLIKSENINIKKLIKLILQILFYLIILTLIFVGFNLYPFSIKGISWWFAKTYLILYLIHPYINKMLNNLEKLEYKNFLLMLTIIFSIFPTITSNTADDGNIMWFIYLYSIGGYLKKYLIIDKEKTNKYAKLTFLTYLLTFSITIVFLLIGKKYNIFLEKSNYLFGMEKITTLIISVLFVLTFINLDIKSNKIINVISSTTFGIYLIHDNYYVKKYIWEQLFKNSNYANSNSLILYSIFVIIIVFLVCSLIEFTRIKIIEKMLGTPINIYSKKIENKLKKII